MSAKEIVIAAILPDNQEYSDRLMEGALGYLDQQPNLRLLPIRFKIGQESDLGKYEKFDGAIVFTTHYDHWLRRALAGQVPVVSMNAEWRAEGVASLVYSSTMLFRSILDNLSQAGCDRVIYTSDKLTNHEARINAATDFVKYACDNGFKAEAFSIADADKTRPDNEMVLSDEVRDNIARKLESIDCMTGIHCVSDYVGYFISRVAGEMGVRIPEDLALTGEPDYHIARCCRPPLSSFPLGKGIGYQALEMLYRHLAEGVELAAKTFLPPPPIVWRESSGGGSAAVGFVQRARVMIHDRACEGITVRGVAELLSIPPQTLNDAFRRAFGYTAGEHLRRERLEHAKHWLLTSNESVASIAGRCGYSYQSKFTRFFKRMTGMTPSQYRNNHR